MATKTPRLLRPEQRTLFTRVPDLSVREIARYYTLSSEDLAIIGRHRRDANRLGFAVQLALLRFPGRALTEVAEVPAAILTYLADQVGVKVNAFDQYGLRENTLYEHLEEIRREFGFRTCTWTVLRRLGHMLLPLALESDRPIPLIEAALEELRTNKVIAVGITTVEELVWLVLRRAERHVVRQVLDPLAPEQYAVLDALVHGPKVAKAEKTANLLLRQLFCSPRWKESRASLRQSSRLWVPG